MVLRLDGKVKGRQYDRLGHLSLGGVEILRTSTPQPSPDGITWSVEKDVTRYRDTLARPQPVEMLIGNVVNDTYTGVIDVKVTLTFYAADGRNPAPDTPDRVLRLIAAQPGGVRDLEQGGAPEGRQPALAALAANAQHLLVGVIEELFQLGLGERPSFRLALGFVGGRCGIPVVDHLDWVSTEVPQALVAPAVGGVGQEVAELAHGALVVAQGGADAAVHGPQIGRPFVDVLRRPLPRHRIGVPGEGPDRTFLVIDVPQREIPGELLITPALDHRLEDLLVRPQQRQAVHQVQPSKTWNETVPTHPPSLSVHRI